MNKKYTIALIILAFIAILIFVPGKQRGDQGGDARRPPLGARISDVSPSSAPSTVPQTPLVEPIRVRLEALNNSGETGIALINEKGGGSEVVVSLSGAPAKLIQPIHIHTGSCAKLGKIKYSLNDAKESISVTPLSIARNELRSELPLAVDVHKSRGEVDTYVACGEIK